MQGEEQWTTTSNINTREGEVSTWESVEWLCNNTRWAVTSQGKGDISHQVVIMQDERDESQHVTTVQDKGPQQTVVV
jgi:hypothetical protein